MSKLTKEQQDFINQLSHKMKTQNNRGTAQPFGLVVRVEKETWGFDSDYADNIGLYSHEMESSFKSWDDFIEGLKDREYDEIVKELEKLDITTFSTLDSYVNDDFIKELGLAVSGYKEEKTADSTNGCYEGNFFITEQAALDHIKANRHNLKGPDTFGIHLYRNPEMEKLYNIIHALAEGGES